MSDLRLTFAIGDYLHMRELTLGRVKPEGIDLTVLTLPLETIAYRFLAAYEWEVSEFSLATYCAMVANGNCPMVGLPVFPSRVFRHGSIFVRENSPIKTGRRSQGQEDRHPAMDADRRHLCARLDAARRRRAAHLDRLDPGRRQRCRPQGDDDIRAAARLPADQRAGQDARRHAGERRDRRRDLGAAAQRLPRRQARHQAAHPRLPRAGRGLFPQDRHLPDHASGRAAPRRLRGQPLDRAQPDGGVREGQARLPAGIVSGRRPRSCRRRGATTTPRRPTG